MAEIGAFDVSFLKLFAKLFTWAQNPEKAELGQIFSKWLKYVSVKRTDLETYWFSGLVSKTREIKTKNSIFFDVLKD